MKKSLAWGSCVWFVSRSPKSEHFFWKFTVELVLKSFWGRNNSLEAPAFGFFSNLSYDLEESSEFLEPWLVGFWVNRHSKMQIVSKNNFVCVSELPLWIY